jgi:5-methyltetrahydrofolate--homocysteine methyltransferase
MIIIGEKINATRKSIAKAIISKDSSLIKQQIEDQDHAGAHYIDLNAGTGAGDEKQEIDDMIWLIGLALETTEKKLSIDSANPKIVEKAVEYLDGRRPFLINSAKYDDEVLDILLPLTAANNAQLIALAMGKEGIPEDAGQRTQVCLKTYEKAKKAGVELENILFDPLVLPISANQDHGKIALDTLEQIKEEIPDAKTSMGVSNISFGLTKRYWINEAFMVAAITRGLDAAICDPTRPSIRKAISLGRLIAGKDKYCRRYTRGVRKGDFEKPPKKS